MKWYRSDYGFWGVADKESGTLFFQVAETDWHKKLTLSKINQLYFPKVVGRLGSKFDGFNHQIIWHTFPGGLPSNSCSFRLLEKDGTTHSSSRARWNKGASEQSLALES